MLTLLFLMFIGDATLPKCPELPGINYVEVVEHEGVIMKNHYTGPKNFKKRFNRRILDK